jgi:hypothetical protein
MNENFEATSPETTRFFRVTHGNDGIPNLPPAELTALDLISSADTRATRAMGIDTPVFNARMNIALFRLNRAMFILALNTGVSIPIALVARVSALEMRSSARCRG